MKGIQGPDRNVFNQFFFGPPHEGFFSVSARPRKNEWLVTAIGLDPKANLGEKLQFLMKDSRFSPWFKKAKTVETMAAAEALYSPILEPYRNRVLIIGDAAWSQEAENIGSIMCGWRAAHTVTLALADGKLDREGVSSYLDWWERSYLGGYNYADYVKNFTLNHIMDNDEIDYFIDKVKGRYPCQLNAYATFSLLGANLQKALPTIAIERPTLIPKILAFMMLPIEQLMAHTIKAAAFAKLK
jgi:flavin-dependent dehydrogenase